jgi:hypothetical protein
LDKYGITVLFMSPALEEENKNMNRGEHTSYMQHLLLCVYKCKYHFQISYKKAAFVVLKSRVFWEVILCSLVKVHLFFRGLYYLHPQGQKVSHASRKLSLLCFFLSCHLLGVHSEPEDSVHSSDYMMSHPRR